MNPVSPSTPFYHARDRQPVKGASLLLKMGFLRRWKCQLGSSTIFGLSALAVEAYGFTLVRPCVRPSVRPSHHIWRSAHQILMIFCTKLHLNESKKCSKTIFEKVLVWPFFAIFGQKIRFLSFFFKIAHQNFT